MFLQPLCLQFLRAALLVVGFAGGGAQAAISVVSTTHSAGMVTVTLNSTSAGTGYLTLLPAGQSCGSTAQTLAGQNSTGAAAYRKGSLVLAAGTDARYTVRNLAQASDYTLCATNGADDTSAAFSTTAMAAFGAASWEMVGGSGFSADSALHHSLSFAPDGSPYAAFADAGLGYKTRVMRFDGTAWGDVGSPVVSVGSAVYQSLSFAPDGTPYVAFGDDGNGNRTTVMRFDGADWINVGSPGFSAVAVSALSLAVAPDGTPYVAFRENGSGNKTTVMRFDGTAWATVGTAGFFTGQSDSTSLSFAPDGSPYLDFKDAGNGNKLVVMRFDGAAWEAVGGSGVSAAGVYDHSLSFAPDGAPHVGFSDVGNGYRATVMRFNGTAWANVGGPGFSSDTALAMSLSFAPDGSPYMAFIDRGNGDKLRVMRFNGTAWADAGDTALPQREARLSVAPDGSPYIAYTNGANRNRLMVMRLTGTAGAPTAVTGLAGGRQTTVGFTPASDGGSAVTHYTATATAGGAFCTATPPATSCVVQGLTPGVPYAFTVVATNGVGDSPASAASAPVVALAVVAGAPTAVTALAGNRQATVSFTPAADDGGSAVTRYTVTATPGGAFCTAAPPATSCVVAGLTPLVPHTFSVVATNGAGDSAASTDSAPVIPMRVPDSPTAVTVAVTGTQVEVGFTPPASDGASTITRYTVTATPGGASCTATPPATSCVFTGLTPGVSYTFVAVATNGVGNSVPSATSPPVTPQMVNDPAVPLPGNGGAGGSAAVVISGGPAGCTVVPGSVQFNATVPPEGSRNAGFPLGVFSFSATGCAGATLTVAITYPRSLAGLALQKFGPPATGQAARWFTPSVMALSNGDHTVTYQVTDNGEGDNDTTAGDIADPFAPMLLAPDGVGIPTLGEWGLLLMSCLLAACAMVVQSLKSNPDEHRMQPIEASHAQHLQHTAGRAHAHARLSSVSGQCSEIASDSRQRASSSSACCARSARMGEGLPLDQGSPGRMILAFSGEPGPVYEQIRQRG